MKMQQSPSISPTPLFNLGEFQPFLKLVLFFFLPPLPMYHPPYPCRPHSRSFFLFFFHILLPPPSPYISYSSLTRLVYLSCPQPPPPSNPAHPLFSIKSGFDCTMLFKKKKNRKSATLYSSTIRTGSVLPLFVL